jgi:DnaJ like chaperone protein
MGYWGKLIGGVAGLVMGGPFGAVMGAALGHAADQGALPRIPQGLGMNPGRLASMLGGKDQIFAIGVVVLSAKLAKVDGVVTREEIDAFKRHFRIPPANARDVGRLFDQARDSQESFEPYAKTLGDAFADNPGVLEDVMAALFAIARADGAVNVREMDVLKRIHAQLRLSSVAWDRASGTTPRFRPEPTDDAYQVLGVARTASNDEVRAAWKTLVRANHPDSLASRGVPAEFIASATDKVAGINAAWDRIKRERGL